VKRLEVTTSGTASSSHYPAGTVDEANSAVEAAAAAFGGWSNTSPKERGEFLVRISEKLPSEVTKSLSSSPTK